MVQGQVQGVSASQEGRHPRHLVIHDRAKLAPQHEDLINQNFHYLLLIACTLDILINTQGNANNVTCDL